MSCIYEPFNGWVVVQRDEVEKQAGAIEIPQNARQVKDSGTVIATSPEAESDFGLVVGSRVIFPVYAGNQRIVEEDGVQREYLFIKCTELMAKLRG